MCYCLHYLLPGMFAPDARSERVHTLVFLHVEQHFSMRKVYNSRLARPGYLPNASASAAARILVTVSQYCTQRNKMSPVPPTPRKAAISVLAVSFSLVRKIHRDKNIVMNTSIEAISATRDTVLLLSAIK